MDDFIRWFTIFFFFEIFCYVIWISGRFMFFDDSITFGSETKDTVAMILGFFLNIGILIAIASYWN